MIAAPEGANDTHLQALAALSRLLVDPDFVAKLKEADSPEACIRIIPNSGRSKSCGRKSRTGKTS